MKLSYLLTFLNLLSYKRQLKILVLTAVLIASCQSPPSHLFYTESLTPYNSEGQIQYFKSTHNLSGIRSKEYYEIKAKFIHETSFLELLSHSRDSYLGDGIIIRAERDKNDLRVKIKSQGFPYETLLLKRDYFLNQLEIDWTIEVHNGIHEAFRVQIWENFIIIKNVLKQKTQSLTSRNLMADSLSEGFSFIEQAYGLKWGLKAYRTEVKSAERIFNKRRR